MGSDDSAKAQLPHQRRGVLSILWALATKLMLLLALSFIFLNVFAARRVRLQFKSDMSALEELDTEIRRRQLLRTPYEAEDSEEIPIPTVARPKPATRKVLQVLKLVEKIERSERAPAGRDNKVVILGKGFILKRDFELWDYTFQKAKFGVAKVTKQDLQQHKHPDWVIMKCLDLFDGKSHCIEPSELPQLKRYQKVSRLYGLRKTLWNKDRFCETMSSAIKGYSNLTEFVFPCWILPTDFNTLIHEARSKYSHKGFILKPTDRGEGNGIIVVDDYRSLAKWKQSFPDNDEVVVQTYLPNPFLINQRKWDMRTYVLVTSIHPLRVYMYRDGLVRFASSKYEPDAKGGGKKTSYLTNTSVNKKTGIDVEDLTWPFPQLYAHLKKLRVDPEILWQRIERAVVQVLLSAEPAFVRNFKKLQNDYTCVNCFQLLGVDIIVDDNLTPRVIEVNGEPSMQLSGEKGSHYDATKKAMAHDLVSLLFNKDSFSRTLTSDLSVLELSGFSIGYEALGGCVSYDDVCLRSMDIKYLLDMKKEEQNMGGFRRIYPSKTGDYYTDFLEHLETKMPYGTITSTNHLHKLVTALAKASTYKTKNSIENIEFYQEGAAEEQA